jgi:DNA mismatch repair protein MutH
MSTPRSPSAPPPRLPGAPATEGELLTRAQALAGMSLRALAERLGQPVPDLRRAKGWTGQILELALGATAQSRASPDFPELGIELKTLPVTRQGKPVESTFVCTIPLLDEGHVEWRQSRVYCKLRRVLWVPIDGRVDLDPSERLVGSAFLWSPNESEEAALRADWEELAGRIGAGQVEELTGYQGQYLQVRPKGANSQARRRAAEADGSFTTVLPRGFYLRPAFTQALLANEFGL